MEYDNIIYNIKNSNIKSVNGFLGLTYKNSFLNVSNLKFCKQCMTDDKKIYGEIYLHKEHQINGSLVCYKHKDILLEYKLPEIKKNFIDIIKINNDDNFYNNLKQIENIDERIIEVLFDISKDLHLLLNIDNNVISNKETNIKYWLRLNELGFLSKKYTKFSEIECSFKKFYSDKILNLLNCNFESGYYKDNWLNKVVTKRKMIHTLKNILFIKFLFGGFRQFLDYKRRY